MGNRDSSLRGQKKNFAGTKTQRRGAVTPQETEPELPGGVGGPPVEHGLAGANHSDGGTARSPWRKPSWSLPATLP